MPLAAGTRVGSYEVLNLLGAGGMGEVYRAADERLGREVALKVLPESVASDRDRLARFRQEAQVLASLNHPHIAALYGIEEGKGITALAMELVAGPTLADQIAGHPMPPREAIAVARQIAEALEYAHERGVIHRDLKPANIKITPDGVVKVLDFGTAKVARMAGSPARSDVPATFTLADTAPGVVLGTAAYMSPEQAAGRPVDRRADIWSFGVVLWEMLTGERLFAGESAAEVIADVLRTDIDVGRLPPATPPAVRALVGRCLDRSARNRLRDIGEARVLLEQCGADASGIRSIGAPESPTEAARSRVLPLRSVLAGVAVLGAAGLAWTAARHLTELPADAPVVRFQVSRPADTVLRAWDSIALSPDGRQLAITAGSRPQGAAELWLRPLDAVEPRLLPGTEGAFSPFWSPDGAHVGFIAGRTLKTVSVAGGHPVTVCTISGYALGGTWAPDGTIVFASDETPLQQVAAAGGEPRPLLAFDTARGEHRHHSPHVLPGGRHVIYVSEEGPQGASAIYLADMSGGTPPRRLVAADGGARYVAGYLVYSWGGNLVGQPFDGGRLQTTGDPFVIVGPSPGGGGERLLSRYDAAGTVLAYTRRPASESRITIVARDGRALGALAEPGTYRQLALSPDDRYLAIDRLDPVTARGDIWLLDVAGNFFTRLTLDAADDKGPVWSPDSRWIAFSSNRRGSYDVFRRRPDGDDELVVGRPGEDTVEDWAADDSLVVTSAGGREFVRVPLHGRGTPQTMIDAPGERDEPHVSPDGQWIAWSSRETGRWEVYAARFPELTERRQVTADGGFQPKWRADGRELIYMATDGRLVAVPVTMRGTMVLGRPTPLFRANVAPIAAWNQYAVGRDGTRFFVIEQAEDDGPVTVVLNWIAGRRGE